MEVREHVVNLYNKISQITSLKQSIGAKVSYCFVKNTPIMKPEYDATIAYLKDCLYLEYENVVIDVSRKLKEDNKEKFENLEKLSPAEIKALNEKLDADFSGLIAPAKEKYKDAIDKKNKFFSEKIDIDLYKISFDDFCEKQIMRDEIDTPINVLFWKPILME